MEPQENEIKDLLSALEGNVEGKEEPKDVLQGKEEKSEEVVEEISEEKEEVVEAEESEEEEKEVVKEVKETPAEDEKDKTINSLRAQIEELSKPKEVKEEKKEEVKEPEISFAEQDFVSDIDVDEVLRDPKAFNSLLNKVYAKAAKDITKLVSESTIKSIPEIVRKNVEITNSLKSMHDKFYSEHPQLAGFKQAVAAVFSDIQSENQGKTYDDLLKLTATETYKRLGLQKEALEKAKLKAVPTLPSKKGTGSRPSTTSLPKGEKSEIEDMLKSVGE